MSGSTKEEAAPELETFGFTAAADELDRVADCARTPSYTEGVLGFPVEDEPSTQPVAEREDTAAAADIDLSDFEDMPPVAEAEDGYLSFSGGESTEPEADEGKPPKRKATKRLPHTSGFRPQSLGDANDAGRLSAEIDDADCQPPLSTAARHSPDPPPAVWDPARETAAERAERTGAVRPRLRLDGLDAPHRKKTKRKSRTIDLGLFGPEPPETFQGFASSLQQVRGQAKVSVELERFDGFGDVGDDPSEHAWYAGDLGAAECEALVCAAEHGDFLVRSRDTTHVLVVNDKCRAANFSISEHADGKFAFGRKTFEGLGAALDHLYRTSLLGSTGLPLHLGRPATLPSVA